MNNYLLDMTKGASNRFLVFLALLAISIAFIGILGIAGMRGINITGALTSGTGVTNLSITESFSIRMVRNLSDFGASTLPSSVRTWIATNAINGNASQTTTFYNGSEGNGSANDYGTGTHVYPFVVENDGNDNTTCVKITGTAAASFIGGSSFGGPAFNAMETDNETASGVSCGGAKASSWMPVNGTWGALICAQLRSDATIDELRIHWQVGIPDDASPSAKSNTITVTAYNNCP